MTRSFLACLCTLEASKENSNKLQEGGSKAAANKTISHAEAALQTKPVGTLLQLTCMHALVVHFVLYVWPSTARGDKGHP